MPRQAEAITGIRRPSTLRDIITAEARFLPDLKRIEATKAAQDEQFALDQQALGLAERRLLSDEAQAASALKIGKTQVGISAALGLTNLAQTDIGGKVVSGIGSALGFGGTQVAELASAETLAGIGSGETILAGAKPFVGKVAGTQATAQAGVTGSSTLGGIARTGAPIAAAVGLELVRENVGEFAEEQVGTSAKHGVNVLGRAGQGAAIGSVVPGIGTAIGAAIGTAVGVAEETFGWYEEQLGTTAATILNPIGALFDWLSGSGGDSEPGGFAGKPGTPTMLR